MTFISQTHAWRGFSLGRDLMDVMFTCGFVTFYISRRPLLDRIVKLLSDHERMMDDDSDSAGC